MLAMAWGAKFDLQDYHWAYYGPPESAEELSAKIHSLFGK